MRLRLLALFALLWFVPALAAVDPPKEGEQPLIVLPPDERVPLKVFRIEADGLDWGVLKLNVPEAHKTTKGRGVRVAVLDTGVDPLHPDLAPALADPNDLKNFTTSRFGVSDKQGHGTHCIGRVLGRGTNHGVAPEALGIVGKVLGDDGSGSTRGIALGIRWAATERFADVISMSLGGPSTDPDMPPAIKEADALGVIVICAAGNEGPGEGTVGYPGGYAQCVAIGAVDINNLIARFSSRGPQVFVSAPGVNIRSQYPGGQYATMSGTSMACPHVAGLAALWIAAHPEIPKKDRPAGFRRALLEASLDLGPVGRDTAFGYGLPDAAKLVINTAPKPKPKDPDVIQFGPEDFSPSGLEKLKKLGLDGFGFTPSKSATSQRKKPQDAGRVSEAAVYAGGGLVWLGLNDEGPRVMLDFDNDRSLVTWDGKRATPSEVMEKIRTSRREILYAGTPDLDTYGLTRKAKFTTRPWPEEMPLKP